jgi:hypothetical protein
MQAELRPGPRFEQFVHRADAAGQGEERVGQIAHEELALRHRADDVQLRQTCMPDLAIDQHLRNHADDAAAARQRRLGERAHQTDAPAAVHEREAALRDQLARADRELGVRRPVAWARPAENSQGFHERILWE